MAEAIDIRALNEQIERQSAFVTNLMTGMDQVIVGQKTLDRIFNLSVCCPMVTFC